MGFAPFDPETAVTYEIGLRSEWLHRRLRLNATLFDTEYQDIQLRQQTLIDGEFTTLIENAARARITGRRGRADGARLERADPERRLRPSRTQISRRRPGSRTSLSTAEFERTPRNSFAISMNYEMPVRSGMLELHGDYSYRSKEQFQILPAINDQNGYGLFGARITFGRGRSLVGGAVRAPILPTSAIAPPAAARCSSRPDSLILASACRVRSGSS